MNALTRQLTDREKFEVGEALEKLFILQDRPINDKKKALFVEAISMTGRPLSTIMATLRSLEMQDLRTIKVFTIIDEMDKFGEPDGTKAEKCEECGGSGNIVMVDNERRPYALACTCVNGRRFRQNKNKLVLWNGLSSQYSNGRELRMLWSKFSSSETDGING